MISKNSMHREDSRERLLQLAMDVSDGKEVDWDSEMHMHPELRETLERGQVVASIANICGLPNETTSMTATVPLSQKQTQPGSQASETQHPKTWGHLRDLQFIDSGKFGDVYRAHDTRLDIDVALKLLKHGHDLDCSEFLNEARRLAKVHHDNVVTVHGADEHDGRIGIWTDYLVGQNLEEQLAEKGPMGECEAISSGMDLCRALAAVHKAGLIHNDVKTNNIMRLEANGRHVLMDFGCVGEQSSHADSEVTLSGTPVYMAPERILQKASATQASDIYALGVVLYRLVTNEYPVDGKKFGDIVSKHRRRAAVPLLDRCPDLNRKFIEVVERALEHDPRDRFQSVGDMERALRESIVPEVELQPVPGPAKNWWTVVIPLAAVLVVLVVMVGWWKPWNRSEVLPPQLEVALFQKDVGQLLDGDIVHPGAQVMMRVTGKQDSYLYVLNAAEREPRSVNLLFPTNLDLENPLAASATYHLPGYKGDQQAYWDFTSPGGVETILLVVSRQALEEIESNDRFNQIILGKMVDHINANPEATQQTRGIGNISVGEPNVLAHLQHTLKKTHGDNVWIWSMQLRCEPEDVGALSNTEPGEGQ